MRARVLTHEHALLARGAARCDVLFALWGSWALSACVVSDFDKVLKHESASVGDRGCEQDAGSAEESASCETVSELDAASDPDATLDAAEEELDAAIGSERSDGQAANDADAAALSCLDAASDPQNCGACGTDCNAPSASVSCENGHCNRVCKDNFGDCNGDLVLGALGNGCEARIDNDISNCGECRRRCVAPKDGLASCTKQLCYGQRLMLTSSLAGDVYGDLTGGGPFSLQCPDGQVVTGIEGIGDSVAYGLIARCASLKVTRSAGAITVTTNPASSSQLIGGNISGPPPDYQRNCPPGTLVSAVSGTLWNWPGKMVLSVKTLTLTCASVRVAADQKITLATESTLSIGTPEATPPASFSRTCAGPGAVGGFSGRAGAYIDAITVHCGKLVLQEEIASSVTVSASAVGAASDTQ